VYAEERRGVVAGQLDEDSAGQRTKRGSRADRRGEHDAAARSHVAGLDPLNIAQIGNAAPSNKAGEGMTGASGFEAVAMPVALKKKMGLTAMKVFAQEKLLGKAAPEMLLRYAMSLPVAATTVGMPQLEHIDFNISVAKSFKPLSPAEMKSLPASVSAQMRASIDRFFSDHQDC
jgi:aryl-alcohol dehydrogenase-like predicted oxidoreductase